MPFSESLKLQVRRKAHFKCCLCHALGVEVHHIVPQSEGGPDTEDNAAPLCPTCHDIYGANPEKRKFIREVRDFWYEFCGRGFAQGTGLLARFEAKDNRLKGTGAARLDEHNGVSVLDFDAADEVAAEFSGTLSPAYRGSGVEARLYFSVSATEVGTVQWSVSIRRNLTSDRHQVYGILKLVSQASPPVHGAEAFASVVFADGPELDNVGAGDPFQLRVERKATDPGDTAAGDAELIAIELFELIR